MLGVYDEYLVEPLAEVLIKLGVKRGCVVYGQDKLDEISISAPTTVCMIDNGTYQTTTITPEQFGLKTATKEDIVGGTPEENAELTKKIFGGEITGPKRDIVLMNAGLGFYIYNKVNSIEEGIQLANEIIESKKALETLKTFVEVSNG